MNAHTKQQQDKVFEMDFIDIQKFWPPVCTSFGMKSYVIIYPTDLDLFFFTQK